MSVCDRMKTYDRDGKVIADEYYKVPKGERRGQAKWGTEQRVGRTEVGQYLVSTVWLLGIDHQYAEDGPPLIFETMIFNGEGDEHQNDLRRYSTEEQAMRGHLDAVDRLRAGKPPFVDPA